jgi:hypothetical protein
MIKKQMLRYSISLLVVFCILFTTACDQGPDPPPPITSDNTNVPGDNGTGGTDQDNPGTGTDYPEEPDNPVKRDVGLAITWRPDQGIAIAGIPPQDGIVLAKTGGTAHLTLTVTGDYTAVECFVDGKKHAGSDGIFTIDAAQYLAARHIISIIVLKNGIPYSREFSFTIINGEGAEL